MRGIMKWDSTPPSEDDGNGDGEGVAYWDDNIKGGGYGCERWVNMRWNWFENAYTHRKLGAQVFRTRRASKEFPLYLRMAQEQST